MTYFDGRTYDPARDSKRLTSQYERVWRAMSDRTWHTLPEIARLTGSSETGVAARLRDMRKARFGAHTVERYYVGEGQWAYRLIPNDDAAVLTGRNA